MEELTALGFFTTPVVQIDDEIVVGFDRERLKDLLGPDSNEPEVIH